MIEFGKYAAELVKANPDNFRIFGPDETKSNRMNEVFKVTNRQWLDLSTKLTTNGCLRYGRRD